MEEEITQNKTTYEQINNQLTNTISKKENETRRLL